jgi:hypothetical protein
VRIHPIQTGTVQTHQRRRIGEDGPLRRIVVDTGEHARAATYLPSHDPQSPARLQALA